MHLLTVPRPVRALAVLALLACSLLFLDRAATQAQTDQPPGPTDPTVQSLLNKADQKGTVLVIVGLRNVPYTPEGNLPAAAAAAQQANISQAQSAVLKALAGDKFRVAARYQHFPYIALALDRPGLEHLVASGLVDSIEENIPHKPTMAPELTLIGAGPVQTAGDDGDGYEVVILDTGIDNAHPYFGSRIDQADQMCFSNMGGALGSSFANSSLCPNGLPSQLGSGSASATTAECYDAFGDELCYHGTHVAGIAAGSKTDDPAADANGIAPHAKILSVQIFTRFDNDPSNGFICDTDNSCVLTFTSDYLLAMDKLITWHGHAGSPAGIPISSINMSLGGGPNETKACDGAEKSVKSAIDSLLTYNVATVIAAGNSGTGGVSHPGCISSAVTVGAVDDFDSEAWFSNGNSSMLDLFAPGVGVLSSVPGLSFGDPSTYTSLDGTSMATPMITGSFAAMREANPSASVATILKVMRGTGVLDFVFPSGKVPRINLLAADTTLKGKNPPNAPSGMKPLTGALNVANGTALTWTDTDPDQAYIADPLTYDVLLDQVTPPVTAAPGCTGLTTAKCVATGMDGNKVYYWQVVAHDAHGDSTNGPILSFTSADNPPNPPSNPSPISGTTWVTVTPTLTWTDSDPDTGDSIQSYSIYLSKSANPATVVCGPQAGTSCSISTPLTANTKYYWKVMATDTHGKSTTGPVWNFTTLFTAPALTAPKNGSAVYTQLPKLTWKAWPLATGYHIQIDPTSTFDSNAGNAWFETDTTTASYPVSSPLAFGTYFWRVKVKDSVSSSGYSLPFSFDVTLNKTPAKNLASMTGLVKFAWQAVKNATNYHLQVYDSLSDCQNLTGTPELDKTTLPKPTYAMTTLTDTALDFGSYYWHVQSDAGVTTPRTPCWRFDVTALKAPKNGSTVTNFLPRFSWTANKTPGTTYTLNLFTVPDGGSASPFGAPKSGLTTPSYTGLLTDGFGYGHYQWNIQQDTGGGPGPNTPNWDFYITILAKPLNNSFTTDTTPTFSWKAIKGETDYTLQISSSPDFSTHTDFDALTKTTYTLKPTEALVQGQYYWRVVATGAATYTMPGWSLLVGP